MTGVKHQAHWRTQTVTGRLTRRWMSRCEITLSPEYPVSPSLLKSARLSLSDCCSKLLPARMQHNHQTRLPMLPCRSSVSCGCHS